MSSIIEMAVEGLACRLAREALILAVEARDLAAFLLAIRASGCQPVIPA